MSRNIVFTKVPEDNDLDRIGSRFCKEHGDNSDGTISNEEYDRLFDHVGTIISKYATYSDEDTNVDFSGSRYVDQIPWITLVAADNADPRLALQAALEAIQSAHRPMAVSFDYYPDSLMVLPPNIVYSTFDLAQIQSEG